LYSGDSVLLDFSNGKGLDETIIRIKGNLLAFGIGSSLFKMFLAPKLTELKLQTWYHIAYVVDGHHLTIYLNGVIISKSIGNYPKQISTSYNFIGSSIHGDTSKATYHDIKIFNVALKPCQIMNEYVISNSKYRFYFSFLFFFIII